MIKGKHTGDHSTPVNDFADHPTAEDSEIFVTNDYFRRRGIGRNVLHYHRTVKGDIVTVGILNKRFLYRKSDADRFIEFFWKKNVGKVLEGFKVKQKI